MFEIIFSKEVLTVLSAALAVIAAMSASAKFPERKDRKKYNGSAFRKFARNRVPRSARAQRESPAVQIGFRHLKMPPCYWIIDG